MQTNLELGRADLALLDPVGRSDVALGRGRGPPPTASSRHPRDAIGALRAEAARVAELGEDRATILTTAELRLLPLLTTHLSFREIAERLFVSRNTVKTQAISVYRKLDVSSRSDAIARAAELGLVDLESSRARRVRPQFILSG